jgi:hypothetical protein
MLIDNELTHIGIYVHIHKNKLKQNHLNIYNLIVF